MSPPRLRLAHLPTPLWRNDALDALLGCELWVKRDDMTGGGEAGNKIRKLEYLLADAQAQGATTVITCGGEQSNHARATTLLGRSLGLEIRVLLRTKTGAAPAALVGNLLLMKLAGASVRFVDPAQYAARAELLAAEATACARSGQRPYVIVEGGSSGLGSLGYVEAMREVREQIDLGLAGARRPFDVVTHACGSGGTAAGVAVGARAFGVAQQAWAMAVCDSADYFRAVIARILGEMRALGPDLGPALELRIEDRFKGPGYAVASPEQRHFIAEVARCSGLLLDPVYTGKALYALSKSEERPRRVLFLHTGGLPGLLAQAPDFAPELSGL